MDGILVRPYTAGLLADRLREARQRKRELERAVSVPSALLGNALQSALAELRELSNQVTATAEQRWSFRCAASPLRRCSW